MSVSDILHGLSKTDIKKLKQIRLLQSYSTVFSFNMCYINCKYWHGRKLEGYKKIYLVGGYYLYFNGYYDKRIRQCIYNGKIIEFSTKRYIILSSDICQMVYMSHLPDTITSFEIWVIISILISVTAWVLL